MVCTTLGVQIALSYGYLMFALILGFMVAICRGGNAVIRAFQGLIDAITAGHANGWFQHIDMNKYCDATKGMDTAAMQCFWGCLLSVVSQTIMLMVISEEKGRIEGTMAEGAKGPMVQSKGKAKSKRREDSDSSSP